MHEGSTAKPWVVGKADELVCKRNDDGIWLRVKVSLCIGERTKGYNK